MRTRDFSNKCFYNALAALCRQKAYKDISISDICTEAGYNRSTFYRSFKTKEDLILQEFKTRAKESFLKHIPNINSVTDDEFRYMNTELFRYIQTIPELIDLVQKASVEGELVRSYIDLLSANGLPEEEWYFYIYHVRGYLEIVLDWVRDGMRKTPEYMGNLVTRIVRQKSLT